MSGQAGGPPRGWTPVSTNRPLSCGSRSCTPAARPLAPAPRPDPPARLLSPGTAGAASNRARPASPPPQSLLGVRDGDHQRHGIERRNREAAALVEALRVL